ncbi:MAG TPA: hemerythrin domain-containing protein [Devosia sp.]|uniref:hemerythrin domain-containing protein n=1 Tax=Devosia sp. TaxID=1871048 RepID=UPI002DDD01DB|nr:hemerythrin domain-containing protein [Devosia sp.]HEV2515840.1 hemerythrin domain-containing protein [Devosia sp.]
MSNSVTPLESDGLAESFRSQMHLCDLLEGIADSLPSGIDQQQCLRIAEMILPVIRRAHLAEEVDLFPRILARVQDGSAIVDQLRSEHFVDECFAEEVQYELLLLGRGRPVLPPDAVGYMLRGFFDGLRRHCRTERELAGLSH